MKVKRLNSIFLNTTVSVYIELYLTYLHYGIYYLQLPSSELRNDFSDVSVYTVYGILNNSPIMSDTGKSEQINKTMKIYLTPGRRHSSLNIFLYF